MELDVTVSADGSRVGHLSGGILRVCDLPDGFIRTLADGVDMYGMDRTGEVVTWTSSGRLFRRRGDVTEELVTPGPVELALPDPGGRTVGYRSAGTLRVVREDGADELLAGEPDAVAWGEPGDHARYFGRAEGWWWAPDSQSILACRSQHEQTSLHLLDLDGGWVDVHWDREIYPYLGNVRWADGGPLITVLRRSQAHGLVLAVDRRTGETQVHAELADPRWVNPIPGTPRHLADGRVLVGGEIAHDGYDARCLFADGTLLTPPNLYVRRVVGRLGPGAARGELGDLLVEASENDPAEQHLFRVRGAASGGMMVHRLTSEPGWYSAECAGDTLVIGQRGLELESASWTVWHGGRQVAALTHPARPEHHHRATMDRVTDRRLPTAVVYPEGHVFGRRLPVLLLLAEDPSHQSVRSEHAAFVEARRWAGAGFAVVLVDGRGALGVSPGFEKVVHRRLADLALADQVEALRTLADKHSDLDLIRVAALGRGYGGWLAALLALRRPEAVMAAVAIQPWDWADLPSPMAERYLGPKEFDGDVYERHDLDGLPSNVLVSADASDAEIFRYLTERL